MLKQVTEDQLREHIKFLSNDLLEGRAPGTRGEALATAYIASHFRTMGLNPINNTYIHDVPMRGLTAQKGELFITRDNYAPLNLTFASDFTADSDLDNSYPYSSPLPSPSFPFLSSFSVYTMRKEPTHWRNKE
jgi:hypothetical protein